MWSWFSASGNVASKSGLTGFNLSVIESSVLFVPMGQLPLKALAASETFPTNGFGSEEAIYNVCWAQLCTEVITGETRKTALVFCFVSHFCNVPTNSFLDSLNKARTLKQLLLHFNSILQRRICESGFFSWAQNVTSSYQITWLEGYLINININLQTRLKPRSTSIIHHANWRNIVTYFKRQSLHCLALQGCFFRSSWNNILHLLEENAFSEPGH